MLIVHESSFFFDEFCVSSLLCLFDSPPACLVPGAGLGRLALEISSLGMIII